MTRDEVQRKYGEPRVFHREGQRIKKFYPSLFFGNLHRQATGTPKWDGGFFVMKDRAEPPGGKVEVVFDLRRPGRGGDISDVFRPVPEES